MEAFKLISGQESTGNATLVDLVYAPSGSEAVRFPILSPRRLKITGQDFAMNGNSITPIFPLDESYEYYVSFTNDDIVDDFALLAHQATFGRENDIIRGVKPVEAGEFEEYAGEYSTVFNGSPFDASGDSETAKAEFSFRAPDVVGDYWLWIVARDRSAQDTKLFDYPFDSRHDYKNDTYLGEYETYATKNRQSEFFGTLATDGTPNFDFLYYDDSMSEDDADMVILLRLRIKPHSWDIVRMDIHEPDLVSFPSEDTEGNKIWYMHTFHPKDPSHEFDESDIKFPAHELPRDIYPVYKGVPLKNTDPIGLEMQPGMGGFPELHVSEDVEFNRWKVTDWLRRRYTFSENMLEYEFSRLEGVPVVGGPNPTEFRVRTHEDITKVSLYLVEGEFWDTLNLEQSYGDLDTDPNVIDRVTMTANLSDPNDRKKWGFWEWTLDWDALGLMDLEATYTIAVRAFHQTSQDENRTFYEQFQWPIFVDTRGPEMKLYNVAETPIVPPATSKHGMLQLDIREEIEQRPATNHYPVQSWVALLAMDKGGLFFEENKGFPSNGPGSDNDRRSGSPSYWDYSDSIASVEDFFVDQLTSFDDWMRRMSDIRANEVKSNHFLRFGYETYHTYKQFGGYEYLEPVESNSWLIGFPGLDFEPSPWGPGNFLKNSLKYLQEGVTSVEFDNPAAIENKTYQEYIWDIYRDPFDPFGRRLNDDFMNPLNWNRLPEVVLFHNIDMDGFIWKTESQPPQVLLTIRLNDELGNEGNWESFIKRALTFSLLEGDSGVSKAGAIASCRVNAVDAWAEIDPDTDLKALGIQEIPGGSFTQENAAVSGNPLSLRIWDALLPKFDPLREVRLVGVTLNDYQAVLNLPGQNLPYSGEQATVTVQPSDGDLATNKVIDLIRTLIALGREPLVPLLSENEKFAAQGFNGSEDLSLLTDFTTNDDNLDFYQVNYEVTHHSIVPAVPDDVFAQFNGAANGEETLLLPAVLEAGVDEFGFIDFWAQAVDCVTLPGVEAMTKVWYQNPLTLVQSVTPLSPLTPVSTGIIVELQSDILFMDKNELLTNFVFKKNTVTLTNLNVWSWNGANASALSEPGRGKWFLFEVSPFAPISARIQGVGANGIAWEFSNLFSPAGGFVDRLEGQNQFPSAPVYDAPADNASWLVSPVELTWQASIDPDGQTVSYDVYLWKNENPQIRVSTGQLSSHYQATLSDGVYNWMIVAKDPHGGMTPGPIWQFTVGGVAPTFTVTVQASPTTGGEVRIEGGTWGDNRSAVIGEGDFAQLEAQPEPGFYFEGWYEGGVKVGANEMFNFGPVTSDKTLQANFVSSVGVPFLYLEKEPPISGGRAAGNVFKIKATQAFSFGTYFILQLVSPGINLKDEAAFAPGTSVELNANSPFAVVYLTPGATLAFEPDGTIITVTLDEGVSGTITLDLVNNDDGDMVQVDPANNSVTY